MNLIPPKRKREDVPLLDTKWPAPILLPRIEFNDSEDASPRTKVAKKFDDLEIDGHPAREFDGHPVHEFEGHPAHEFEGHPAHEFEGHPAHEFEGHPAHEFEGHPAHEFEGHPAHEFEGHPAHEFEGHPAHEYPSGEDHLKLNLSSLVEESALSTGSDIPFQPANYAQNPEDGSGKESDEDSSNHQPTVFAAPDLPRTPSRLKTPPLDGEISDGFWHDSEITGHNPDDPNDDGYGINGIGFKPTPAIAWSRSQRRKQQMTEYKNREAREAREKRSKRRKRFISDSEEALSVESSPRKSVRVHFEGG